eukprot:1028008-Prymnesium_polylepis.1
MYRIISLYRGYIRCIGPTAGLYVQGRVLCSVHPYCKLQVPSHRRADVVTTQVQVTDPPWGGANRMRG